MLRNLLIPFFGLCCTLSCIAQKVSIIPYPQKVEVSESTYPLNQCKQIYVKDWKKLGQAALLLQEKLQELGVNATISKSAKGTDGIVLCLSKQMKKAEGYRLEVSQQQIAITGADYAGVVYGIQSLLQEARNGGIKCGVIEDYPHYAWRGYLFDEARHFHGEKKVKQLLDILAGYKINRFHWHLTDQQGWRIEIKRYPKLAQIGGIGNNSDRNAPTAYYTQDQIRDIVAYAAQRGIEVVPEIDMPGHAGAANRAYPEYQVTGKKSVSNFCYNPGKKETYTYLTNILREVTNLFPSRYLHLGGDEVSLGNKLWKENPEILQFMQEKHLANEREVEIYFIQKMIGVVNKMHKTALAWDDIYEANVNPKGCAITWWRHDKKDKVARMSASGFPLILCPRKPLYFDFVQHETHKLGRRWDGFCPLEDVYAFPESHYKEWGVSANDLKNVLGLQANLWGETIFNDARADFMTFPRIIALAEAAWTLPAHKDYTSFQSRMEFAYKYLDTQGIYYFDTRTPDRHIEPTKPNQQLSTISKD